MKSIVRRVMSFAIALSLLGCGKAGISTENNNPKDTGSRPAETVESAAVKEQSGESKATESQPAKELSNEEKANLFIKYLASRNVMYGESCTFTLQKKQSDGTEYDRWWDGLQEKAVFGYSIEDFDSDGSNELLLVSLCGENKIQFEMHEVINGVVTLADCKLTDTGTQHGAMELPCGSRTDGEICGMFTCVVKDSDKRIFLQSSDSYGLLTDGCDTYIASVGYKDGKFADYKVIFEVGSSIDESIPGLNQELSAMGVPNPDFSNMFYRSTPLLDCFNGEAHEILRAQQGTTEYVRENWTKIKIETTTVFAALDGWIEMPELYREENEQNNQGNQNEQSDQGNQNEQEVTGGITYNEYGHPDWFESYPYWKHSSGAYVCCVTGSTGDDLTFDFSDGVYLRGDICYYTVQEDDTINYAYKKGWSVTYDPQNNSLLSYCNPEYTQSTNQGVYYPISEEEYYELRAGLGTGY